MRRACGHASFAERTYDLAIADALKIGRDCAPLPETERASSVDGVS